jgi:large subunit ribosomal protein L6
MSRIGKKPVELPKGVDVKIQGRNITVKGSKGEMVFEHPFMVKVEVKDSIVTVTREGDSRDARARHGLVRSLIQNMVTGVSEGYVRKLEIQGVGYKAQAKGDKVTFNLGYSHPIVFEVPKGVVAQVDKKQTAITLTSFDKQLIGQVAANMRSLRPPDVYKGKGVRYAGEHIKLKAGKAAK